MNPLCISVMVIIIINSNPNNIKQQAGKYDSPEPVFHYHSLSSQHYNNSIVSSEALIVTFICLM